MATLLSAVTLPINPSTKPSTEPTLTFSQLWAGVLEKCKYPHRGFVAAISDCEVLSQTATEIVRMVTFAGGPQFGKMEAGTKVKETIELQEPMMVRLSCAE